MDEEMRFHIKMREALNLEAGMPPDTASTEARRRFGNLGSIKEYSRDIRGGGWMETVLGDLRYSLRTLVRTPMFTFVAVVTLTLGIGANTAIFSVVNAVLLRPLPYKDAGRLVLVFETEPELAKAPVSGPDFVDWRDQNTAFETMAAGGEDDANLTGAGMPRHVAIEPVSDGFFEMLGAMPRLGRPFRPDEDHPGHDGVVILSNALWQTEFGSDPDIVGKDILLDGNSSEVVGVMPAEFRPPGIWGFKPDLWKPLGVERYQETRGNHRFWVMARLSPGVSLEQAQSEMQTIASRLAGSYPRSNSDIGARVIPLHAQVVRKVRSALLVLLGAVGFVLVIACVNVASLLLARAAGREREIAIRRALGATPIRLLRQLLTESMLLSAIGGVAGLLLAIAGKQLLLELEPPGYIPRASEVNLSAGVLAFTLGICFLAGIMFGIPPALRASRSGASGALNERSGTAAGGPRTRRLRSLLVVAEIALGLVLLIGAGLMIHSLQKLLAVNPGFDGRGVMTMRIALPEPRYPKGHRVKFIDEFLDRVRTIPGVRSAAECNNLPLTGGGNGVIQIEGRPRTSTFASPLVQPTIVTRDYFDVMRIPLLQGRVFNVADRTESTPVAVINEMTARKFWPDDNPIGKRLAFGDSDKPDWIEVVGIVGDVHQWKLETQPIPEVYLAYPQAPENVTCFVIRSDSESTPVLNATRAQLAEMDKDLPISEVAPMQTLLDRSSGEQRFQAVLLGIFGLVALMLATVGVYGVMAYSVSQRTHEIAIRKALGATSLRIFRLIMGHGALLSLAGIAIGLAAAFAMTGVMSSLLFGVTTRDPLTFAAMPLLLVTVALIASYIPARRSTKIEPMSGLRHE
jgi:putative ABC transport system permease protein